MRIHFLLLGLCYVAAAQPRLAFEVVSIKPASPPTSETIQSTAFHVALEIDAARVRISGYTPAGLMTAAFRVPLPQVDAPDFARREYFEIQATLPAGATREQVPEMLQTMLAERFKLAYHRETREYKLTVLSVGKNGMKLPRLPDGSPEAFTSNRLSDGTTRMTHNGNIASLFGAINSFGGLQMVDETGLDGVYTWVQDLPPPRAGVTFEEATQDSFRAMIEAAGLKMETRKVPRETIVVDHLEKQPTEN
jgi:uncharacterized protein (TIGR03435 family)